MTDSGKVNSPKMNYPFEKIDLKWKWLIGPIAKWITPHAHAHLWTEIRKIWAGVVIWLLVSIVQASCCLPMTAALHRQINPAAQKAWHQPPCTVLPFAAPASSLFHPFNTVPRPGRAFRGFVQRKRREREQDSAEIIQRYGAFPGLAVLCPEWFLGTAPLSFT